MEVYAIQANGEKIELYGSLALIDDYQELGIEGDSPYPHIMKWGTDTMLIDSSMDKCIKDTITNHLIIDLTYLNGKETHEIYVEKKD